MGVGRQDCEPLGRRVQIAIAGQTVGFDWGRPEQLGTAAYWAEQTRRRPPVDSYALGRTLAEELAACLLGGYGVPAAVGLAAYDAVRTVGLLDGVPERSDLEAVLREPLEVAGRERPVRYRFWRQRAQRLAQSLAVLSAAVPPEDPRLLRDWLTTLPGIGPKTASWIVRNHCGSDDVAIIDVHVLRAGCRAGFFVSEWKLPRDYAAFEGAFCEVAGLARVPAAALDACIWDQMQALGRAQRILLGG